MNHAKTTMALWKTLDMYSNQTLNNTDMMLSYHISHLNIDIYIYQYILKDVIALMFLYHQH